MRKFKDFMKLYVLPDGPFEWIFFSILVIGTIIVIGFLLSMYNQTQ